jgi:hypothetical protein
MRIQFTSTALHNPFVLLEAVGFDEFGELFLGGTLLEVGGGHSIGSIQISGDNGGKEVVDRLRESFSCQQNATCPAECYLR